MAYGLPASKWSLYFSLFHEQNDIIAQKINKLSASKQQCPSRTWEGLRQTIWNLRPR